MKKILILLLLAASMTAQAQFTIGVNSGLNRTHRGESQQREYAYSLNPSLYFGYRLNSHFTVGITGNISYYCQSTHYDKEKPISYFSYTEPIFNAEDALLWAAGLFARYDMPLTDHLSLFADLTADLGSSYTRTRRDYYRYDLETRTVEEINYTRNNNYRNVYMCSVSLTPGVSYQFNSHLAADLYLDILQVVYSHTTLSPREPQAEPSKASNNNVTFNYFSLGPNKPYAPYYQYSTLPPNSNFRLGIHYTF